MAIAILLVLSLAVFVCRTVSGAQVPLLAEPPSPVDLDAKWDLSQQPSVNETGNLIFLSVGSLLQHWPNTLYRNGHTIVPGVVPAGTLLYHVRPDDEIPRDPDWVSTDPEHADFFCFSFDGPGCWQLTLMTTRPLNVLYFDGSSAAKLPNGTMDSQDILIWGEVKPQYFAEEWRRIRDLCDWGMEKGVDGFVRMEMDFEIMLCDFSNGIQIVSFLNLPALRIPRPSPPSRFPAETPPDDSLFARPDKHSFLSRRDGSVFDKLLLVTEAGSWHHHFPGDPRIQLDLARLISFYDIDLSPSLISGRLGNPRWNHRLKSISKDDADRLRERLEEVLGQDTPGSGVDWRALVRVIMNRYGQRLEFLQYILQGKLASSGEGGTNYTAVGVEAHNYVTKMLIPYITLDVKPSGASNKDSSNLSWAKPVFEGCSTTHTGSIKDTFAARLTRSEHLILNSIQATTREICRVLVRVWAEGTELQRPSPGSMYADEPRGLQEIIRRWEGEISGLMKWLAWDIWTTCHPACGFEEMCYLPTWPFFFSDDPQYPPPSDPNPPRPPRFEELPKPFCIPRLPPHNR